MHSTVRQEFGKDMGLVHEAVVTGRKVGAGQEFWSKLAHSKKLFERVVEFVTNDGLLNSETSRKTSKKQVSAATVSVGLYVNEEVKSKYGYFSGYSTSKSVVDQVVRLRELFPDIDIPDSDESLAPQGLGSSVEGMFAYLPWDLVAPTYGEAVAKAFELLTKVYGGKFCNYRDSKLGANYLRESDRKKELLGMLREQQKGNTVLLIPAQFGRLHSGRSVRRARVLMEDAGNEFGLGAWEIAIMLLTHLERLQHYRDLWIDCAGDEDAPDGDGVFLDSVYFSFRSSALTFGSRRPDRVGGRYGSVSGFVLLVASSPA